MDTDRIFIGEVFMYVEKNSKENTKSLGYKVFYYSKQYDSYIELSTRHEYYIERKRLNHDRKFIKEDTLIPYSSFGKKTNNREEIYEEIRKKLRELYGITIYKKPENWDEEYEIALKYYQHHGDLKVPNDFKTKNGVDYDKDGFELGSWVSNQLKLKYRKNKTDEVKEKISKLEKLSFEWRRNGLSKWMEKYELLKKYFIHYGHSNVPGRFRTINGIEADPNGVKLGVWVNNQRRYLKDPNQKYLTEKQIELLNQIGFKNYSTKLEESWTKFFDLAKKYYEYHGNLKIPARFKTLNGIDYDENGYSLGNWLFRKLEAYRGVPERAITEEQIKLLESIGMDWLGEKISPNWMKKYELVSIYNDHFGNIRIPEKFKTIDGINHDPNGIYLASWLRNQIKNYSNLNEEQIDLLKKLGVNFEHTREELEWQERYEMLKTYISYYKSYNIPVDFKTKDGITHDEDGIYLKWWVENQKRYYRENKLSEERAELLRALNIKLEKIANDEIWMDNFNLAKSYYNHYGNLTISASFITKDGINYDKDGVSLGVWLKNQKQQYKGKYRKALTSEQIKLLESIGIEWFHDTYNQKFQEEKIDEKNIKQKQIELLSRLKSLLNTYSGEYLPSKKEINEEYTRTLNKKLKRGDE